ncbi:MAG: CDP-alcohol phosphatidyltransferase family protein [Saprospiraceae bacterium]|nr:CDP-alcohol phosphatidyltransferase family protein [Saprospiraceae bacterium]
MFFIKNPSEKFSIPDWLSLYRILAIPLLSYLMIAGFRELFGIFLLISFLTDAMDGYLARKLNIETQRGAQLDSIGDILTVFIGIVAAFKFEWAFMYKHLLLIIISFALYFLQLVIAFMRYGMPSSFHTILAKISMVIQSVFLVWICLVGISYALFVAAISFSILEAIEEIALTVKYDKWQPNIKGIFWEIKESKSKEE